MLYTVEQNGRSSIFFVETAAKPNGGGKNKLGNMTSDFSQRIGIGLYANMLKKHLMSYKLSNGKVL
jgi:hypothetical protein